MTSETKCYTLPWPLDLGKDKPNQLYLPGSNLVFDFHGDPCQAELTIIMEGNQFMVIPDLLEAFSAHLGRQVECFYVTLPPPRFRGVLYGEPITVGNLVLTIRPQIVMAPPEFMAKVSERISAPKTFMKNKGVVLIVKRGNPKEIKGPEDLLRSDVKIAVSNPKTETNSFNSYLKALSHVPGLKEKIEKEALFSRLIHHREVPAFVYHGLADVAPLYFHFAYYYQNPRFFTEPLFDYLTFPEGEKGISVYQVALVKGHERDELALAWYEFLGTQKARDIYAQHGFPKISQI